MTNLNHSSEKTHTYAEKKLFYFYPLFEVLLECFLYVEQIHD